MRTNPKVHHKSSDLFEIMKGHWDKNMNLAPIKFIILMSLVMRKTQTVSFYRLATVFFRAQRAYSVCFHTKGGKVYMNRKSYETSTATLHGTTS